MFDSVSPSDPATPAASQPMRPVRGDSEVRLSLSAATGRTRVDRLYQRGSLRMRFPNADGCEAVLINTGGGVTGGDRLAVELDMAPGAQAVVTSQAAEKIYRTDGPPAAISMRARLGDTARLDWLPQETILFDGASLQRGFDIEMPATATLTMLECVVLGRVARGETLRDAHWRDAWRVRRDSVLVFADNVRISGPLTERLRSPATGAGAEALATLLHVAPDAEASLDGVRATLAGRPQLDAAASAWNGMMLARFAGSATAVRAAVAQAATIVTRAALPRAWNC